MKYCKQPILKIQFILYGLLTIMAGCAALTIDVDVYKGPLVEDIQVQTKSTTAMAKGALPLLIQLRNTLEEEAISQSTIRSATHWDYPEGAHDHPYPYVKKSTCGGKHKLQEFQNRQNFGDGFIPHEYEFCGEQAFRVNAILSLYEDQRYTPITTPIQTIKQALKDYKTFEFILFPPLESRDSRSREWDRLRMAFKPELQKPTDWAQQESFLLIEKFLVLAKKQLAACEKSGICKYEKDSDFVKIIPTISLQNPTHDFFKILPRLKNTTSEKYRKSDLDALINAGNPYYDNLYLRQAFASAYQRYLAPIEAKREIKKIFELHQSLNTRLGSWPSIGKYLDSSYYYKEACIKKKGLDCEASVTSMFLALAKNEHNIVNLHADLLFAAEGDEKRAFISNTIQAAQSFLKVRKATQKIYRALLTLNHLMDRPGLRMKQIKEEHGEEIPKMIIGMTRGKYLLAAFKELERLEKSPKRKHELSDTNSELTTLLKVIQEKDLQVLPSALPKSIDWLGLGEGKLPTEKEERVYSEKIRERLRERLTTNRVQTSDLFQYVDVIHSKQKNHRLYFGVSGGPDQTLDGWIDVIQGIANIVSDVPIAAGLGQGRTDDGLHTLMKRYSEAVNARPVNKDLIKDERDRLYESLIQFSKTVLFFANNQILLGNDTNDTFQDLQAFKKKEIKKDTQLLQAVGNSILNQIDEIYHRERYEIELDKYGPRETLAMKVAFPKYATEAVDQLIANFEAEAKTTHKQLLERSDEYKEKHKALESANKAKEAAIKARDDAKKKKNQKEETRDLYSKNSGLLFQTEKGTTVGGEIVHVPSSASIGATGTFSTNRLLTGNLRPDDQILTATYKGGESTSANGSDAIGYGGMLDDLMIIGNGTTTEGKIIHGILEEASFESNNHKDITITGNQIPINMLENFTGHLMVPKQDEQKSLSLVDAETTELSLTKPKNENVEEFKVDVEISKGSTISGNVGELNISATVVGCNPRNGYKDDCKVINGTLSDVKLKAISVKNLKSLYIYEKINIESNIHTKLKDMPLKDVTMTVNENLTLKGTMQPATKMTLEGTIDWTNKPLTLGTGKRAYCFKEDKTQCLTGGQLKTTQKMPISLSSTSTEVGITIPVTGKGLTVHWKDQEKLALKKGRITNVWILDGKTTSGNKKINGKGSVVSGATLENDGGENQVILQNPTIKNLHVRNNKFFGLIVEATLPTDAKPATKGTASGGTLSKNGTENSIQASSRIDATVITKAIAEQSSVHLRTSGNSEDIYFATGASLLSGTISGPLESGEIVPNQTGATAKNVTIKNATLKQATVEHAVIQGADGEKFEGTVLGTLSAMLLTEANVSGLQSGNIVSETTLTKAEVGAPNPIEGNRITVKEGKATGVTITNVTLPKGSFTDGTTRNGETQYSAFVVPEPSTDKASRDTFLHNLSNRIDKRTTTSSTHPLRKEQLTNLKKLVEEQGKKKLSTELKRLLPLDNTDNCLGEANACTPSILAHILLQELREETFKAEKANDTATQELKKKETALKTKQTQVDIAKAAQQEFLTEHLEKFKAARDTLTTFQPSILQHLASKDRLTSTDMVYTEIAEFLESQKNASNIKERATKENQSEVGKKSLESGKQKALTMTIEIVKSKPEPLQVLSPAAMQNLDAKEVMDQLITTLKYKHIAAVHDGGKGSAMAKHIKESWDVAKKHRANMVHIRPALAYLRSSYPSTALQGEAPLEWQNMLTANAHRSIPLNSNPRNGKPWSWDRDPRLEIQSQIDKQFWHSVNRIRLHGAGLTNYVLMKDDIGNWTVKNYSSDSRDIIRSARNLALFGYGAGAGRNLLTPARLRVLDSEQPLADQLDDAASVDADNEDTSLLSRQFEKFEKLYAEQTDTDLKAAESLNKELSGNIKEVWSKESALNDVVIDLSTILGFAEETHIAPVKLSRSSTEEKEKEIINRVEAVKKFHREAELKILEKRQELMNNNENKKTRETYEQAISLMTGHVQQTLLDYIGKRQKTINTFRTQATVLHDSVMQ
ncbi:MAG: hypothetical protein NPIRA01_19130 [Nitrospirales bacterium]|nr:MAG: hypothetical protein NPIRA01_19130 [Nitrospirales bacterium]